MWYARYSARNEAEQKIQEDKLWAKMVGNMGVHDQKSAAFAAQFSSDHCLLRTVFLWVVLAGYAAVFGSKELSYRANSFLFARSTMFLISSLTTWKPQVIIGFVILYFWVIVVIVADLHHMDCWTQMWAWNLCHHLPSRGAGLSRSCSRGVGRWRDLLFPGFGSWSAAVWVEVDALRP